MRKAPIIATASIALVLGLAGCSQPASTMSDEASKAPAVSAPMNSGVEKTGSFTGLNDMSVAGTATVSDTELALTGFSSDEGPDLHIYLTNGTDEAAVAAGTMVDAVAFDEATQTFTLDGVDVGDFTHVVIHCDKAKAVFGAAEIA